MSKKSGFQEIKSIDDIDRTKINLEEEYINQEKEVKKQIDIEIQDLSAKIENLENEIKSKTEKIRNNIQLEISRLQQKIITLEDVKFELLNLFTYISAKIEKSNKKERLNYLQNHTDDELKKLLVVEYNNLDSLKNRKHFLENNPNEEIKLQLSTLINRINKINFVKNSTDYKGAIGELLVIEQLKILPDDYIVFNDINLKLKKPIKHKKSYLKSAQIDHLVVGPSGVYVIETKNWSESTVIENFTRNSFTPYDQVGRSGRVVYRYVNSNKYGNIIQKTYHSIANKEIKVKSIIAITGSKIPLKNKEFAKVLYSSKIPYYILRKEITLSIETIQKLEEKFKRVQ